MQRIGLSSDSLCLWKYDVDKHAIEAKKAALVDLREVGMPERSISASTSRTLHGHMCIARDYRIHLDLSLI